MVKTQEPICYEEVPFISTLEVKVKVYFLRMFGTKSEHFYVFQLKVHHFHLQKNNDL
jgi:hypothetical protein